MDSIYYIAAGFVIIVIIAIVTIRRRKRAADAAKIAAVNAAIDSANADLKKTDASVPTTAIVPSKPVVTPTVTVDPNTGVTDFSLPVRTMPVKQLMPLSVGDPIVYKYKLNGKVLEQVSRDQTCKLTEDQKYIYLFGNICGIVDNRYQVSWDRSYWDTPNGCLNSKPAVKILSDAERAVCGSSDYSRYLGLPDLYDMNDFADLPGPFKFGDRVAYTITIPPGNNFVQCNTNSELIKARLTGKVCGTDGNSYTVKWDTVTFLNFNNPACDKFKIVSTLPLSGDYAPIQPDEAIRALGDCSMQSEELKNLPIRFLASDLSPA